MRKNSKDEQMKMAMSIQTSVREREICRGGSTALVVSGRVCGTVEDTMGSGAGGVALFDDWEGGASEVGEPGGKEGPMRCRNNNGLSCAPASLRSPNLPTSGMPPDTPPIRSSLAFTTSSPARLSSSSGTATSLASASADTAASAGSGLRSGTADSPVVLVLCATPPAASAPTV